MKKTKATKQFHTPNTSKLTIDGYGTGVKNPVGRMKDQFGIGTPIKKGLKNKPKALA